MREEESQKKELERKGRGGNSERIVERDVDGLVSQVDKSTTCAPEDALERC